MKVDLCAPSIYSISSFEGFSLQLIMKIVFNVLMVFHRMRIVGRLYFVFLQESSESVVFRILVTERN